MSYIVTLIHGGGLTMYTPFLGTQSNRLRPRHHLPLRKVAFSDPQRHRQSSFFNVTAPQSNRSHRHSGLFLLAEALNLMGKGVVVVSS